MSALVLSIISSSILLILFKYFEKFEVKTFQAITVNYIVAASLGFALSGEIPSAEIASEPWFGFSMILGSMFIAMFYVMAVSAQKVGVSISTVANKMSLAIPVSAGVILYGEALGPIKLLGVIGACIAVAMVVWPSGNSQVDKRFLFLPVLIFFGSGALDSMFKYCQMNLVNEDQFSVFSASLFGVAAITGSIILLANIIRGKAKIEIKSLVAGVLLGVPNYFSIHFLLKALDIPGYESTMIFPINNVGIVILSTILAIILFSEKLSKLNWIGIILAVASIILVAIS